MILRHLNIDKVYKNIIFAYQKSPLYFFLNHCDWLTVTVYLHHMQTERIKMNIRFEKKLPLTLDNLYHVLQKKSVNSSSELDSVGSIYETAVYIPNIVCMSSMHQADTDE